MNTSAQEAVLVQLADRLHENGSWAGETHLQKAAYLLSELGGVDFDFDFILYKHGPFSFELRERLASLCSDGLLARHVQGIRYGPQLLMTEAGKARVNRFPKTLRRHRRSINWIAGVCGARGVVDLERLATALWVTRAHPDESQQRRAEALVKVKPHIDMDDALRSVAEVDRLAADRRAAVLA